VHKNFSFTPKNTPEKKKPKFLSPPKPNHFPPPPPPAARPNRIHLQCNLIVSESKNL